MMRRCDSPDCQLHDLQSSLLEAGGAPMKIAVVGLLISFLHSAESFGAESRLEDVEFESHRVTLSGSIAFPKEHPIHAAIVFIHGSGKQARKLSVAMRFAQAGIAARRGSTDENRAAHLAGLSGTRYRFG